MGGGRSRRCTWLLLVAYATVSAASMSMCSWSNTRGADISMLCAPAGDSPQAVLARCAIRRDVPAPEVLRALEEVKGCPAGLPACADDLDGAAWELVFSSGAAKLPLIDGYMPNRELLNWDFAENEMRLEIETFSFLPSINVVGKGLQFDESAQTLTYQINDKPPSDWRLLSFDRTNGVIAARSSVTGLNVIKRLRGGVRLGRRSAALHGGTLAATAALSRPRHAAAAVGLDGTRSDRRRCPSDRCDVKLLLASAKVPARAREALRTASTLVDQWNSLTSECRGNECRVTRDVLLRDYFSDGSLLMALASDGSLRDATTTALVAPADRVAYARNAMRFESSMRYASSSAKLAQFDPELPSYPKGSYVPKGLNDEQGNLLGTNLENARDFGLDARDALHVVCSFLSYEE